MPAALDVDREAVRTLALAVGITEASRQTGISHEAIRQWSSREQWFAKKPPQPPTKLQPVTNVTTPSQALANILESRKQRTRLNLTKYLVNGSKVAAKSRSPLADAHNVKALAGIMQAVWPEDHQPGVSIQVLNTNGSMA